MAWIFALALGLWLAGRVLDWPPSRTWLLIIGLWLAIIAVHLVLPPSNPLRLATGGGAQVWLVAGAIVALIAGYSRWIGRLKARAAQGAAQTAQTAAAEPALQANRYARHILLHEIGGQGHGRLRAARVLVIGAGGLGAPALMYLAAAGIGRITVVDGDRVELSNLQRQIIHTEARIGQPKAESAVEAMQALNSMVEAVAVTERLGSANGPGLIADQDLVLDGTDNFDTRYLVNRLCVAAGVPLISGALARWEGQVSLFDPARGGACYDCVFPVRPTEGSIPSCAEAGVAGPLPGVIGAMMAVEAVKHLTGAGETLRGRLLVHDALNAETRVVRTRPRPGCPVCGHLHR